MNYKKYVLSIALIGLNCTQLLKAGDAPAPKSSVAWIATKIAIGGGLGAVAGYFINKMDTHFDIEANNKDAFLAELQEYINSDEYICHNDASRMFSHYYNGLTQLAHQKEGIGVSLLKEFSSEHNEDTQKELIKKIQDLAMQIKNDYSRAKTISKYVSIIALAVMGSMFALATESDGHGSGSNYYGGIYMPSSAPVSNFFR